MTWSVATPTCVVPRSIISSTPLSTPVTAPATLGSGTATPEAGKEAPRGGVLDSLEKGRQQLPQVPKSQ